MQKNCWQIKCNHTPETVDKIMLSFRKRGMMVKSLNYSEGDGKVSVCDVVFEEDQENSRRIFSNMIRLEDILEITEKAL